MSKEITLTNLSMKFDKLNNTVEKLIKVTTEGFVRTENKIESEVGKLAVMTARGFEEANRRLDSLENKLGSEINRLDIRLDQMAPNFEIKALNKRVSKIERHLKLV